MTGAPTNHGTITDKEGVGFPGCRILVDGEQQDLAFTVLSFVQPYLDKIQKDSPVCFTTKGGKISRIWSEPMIKTDAKETSAKENAEGDRRMAENVDYLQNMKAGNNRESCTSTEVIPAQAQVQQFRPATALAPKTYSEDEMLLLRNVIAKGCTEPEFKLLMYMANTYGLDPLLKQIWAVKRNDNAPALIFAGRDGMLAIAHRSGQFDGMQSGVIYEGEGKDKKPVSAWCEVWRKDMSHSFRTEVPFSEYNTGFSVWKTNPSAMIIKVAESVCLRKAFSVSGLYCPEEIDTEVRR